MKEAQDYGWQMCRAAHLSGGPLGTTGPVRADHCSDEPCRSDAARHPCSGTCQAQLGTFFF